MPPQCRPNAGQAVGSCCVGPSHSRCGQAQLHTVLAVHIDRQVSSVCFVLNVALSLGCVTQLMQHASCHTSCNVQHATYGMQGRMKHAPYDMQHTRFHMQVHASPAAGAGVAIGPWATRHGRPPQARLHQVTPRMRTACLPVDTAIATRTAPHLWPPDPIRSDRRISFLSVD